MGVPYGAPAGRVAVPVVLRYTSARSTHLRSLAGIVLVTRVRRLHFRGKTILPAQLLFGDGLSVSATITRAQRRAHFFKLTARRISITRRGGAMTTAELEALVKLTRSELASLSLRVTALTSYVTQHFATIESDIDALESATGELRSELRGLGSRIGAVESSLVEVRTALRQHIDQLQSSTNTELDGLKARLTKAEDRVTTTATEVASTLQRITNAEQQSAEVSTTLTGLSARTSDAATANHALVGRLGAVEQSLAGVGSGQLSATVSTVLQLQNSLSSLTAEVTGLGNSVTHTASRLTWARPSEGSRAG
jgi:chromosome segregation ATPase